MGTSGGARYVALIGLSMSSVYFACSVFLAQAASADVFRVAPYVGSWHAHEEHLDIEASGHGREFYNDRTSCPEAAMAGCGAIGTTDFLLTSGSGDTATGTITAATDPKQTIGAPVTIKLVGGGLGLELFVTGGDQGFPFCKSDEPASSHAYCGA